MLLNTAESLVNHKVTNNEINRILGIDHLEESLDGGGVHRQIRDGLTPDQIEAVGKSLGLNTLGANFLAMPTVDFAEWMYPLVESGFPVMLAFNPIHRFGHVVSVMGHTMNSDKWDCEAHLAYRPEALGTHHTSAAWVDHFIINDDNFGMYSCMPPSYLRSKILPQYDMTQRASFAISFLPQGVTVWPYSAEKLAVLILRQVFELGIPEGANRWLFRLKQQLLSSNKGVVARTVMCKKSVYLEHLSSAFDSDGNRLGAKPADVLAGAPEWLWLTEISLPDIYTANKDKLGDILIDATAWANNEQMMPRLVWGWLPGLQITPDALDYSWPLTGHVPLLRCGKANPPYAEW